jgi:SAM-dependent methyltransferase
LVKDKTEAWAGYSKKSEEHYDLERRWAKQNYQILTKLKILPCKRVLDIGCSKGFFLEQCKKGGIKVNGIDVDPNIIDGDVVRRCDVENEKFPYESGTFDLVFSSGLLQHLEKPPVNFILEILRVLKPKGYFTMVVRNEKSWINLLISLYDNFRHKSTWSPQSLEQMFEHYKLKIVFFQPKFMGKRWMWHLPAWLKWHLGSTMFIVGQKS